MTIGEIKELINLSDYIASCGIDLKCHGETDLVGYCPFHADEKPSFVVTPSKQLFHCFGCDKGGDIFKFVEYHQNIDFNAAKKVLEKFLSSFPACSVPREASSPVLREGSTLSVGRTNELLERVVRFYAKTFTDVPEGREYLEYRGISDSSLLSQHRIGYCNGTLSNVLPSSGEIHAQLKELGILLKNGSERFTGCVVIPVFDIDGNITTLYGRYSEKNSPKKHLFLSGRPKGLWNVATIKTYPEIIIVESILDGLSLEMSAQHNVIAISGCNGLGNGQLDLFRENGIQKLTLLLDGDDAGIAGTRKMAAKLNGFSCNMVTLPEEHDPNSYLMTHGTDGLASFLSGGFHHGESSTVEVTARSGSSPVSGIGETATVLTVSSGIRRYLVQHLDKSPKKLQVTVRIVCGDKFNPDTLNLYSQVARKKLCQETARLLDQPAATIEADINKLILACEQYDPESQNASIETDIVGQMSAKDRKEAEAFGRSPDLIESIFNDYETCGLVGEKYNKLLCYLAAVSRKMEDPLSVLILSSSGSGKTALQDATLAFCPPEDVVRITSLSGKALFYKDENSLKHKILALEEGDGAEDASYAIRNLISAKVLIVESAIRDNATGRLTTQENRVEGPTTVFITTTNPNTDSETKSRFWIISIDESREQTRAILNFQRQRHTFVGVSGSTETTTVLNRHRNFQRLLDPVAVVNGYADYLTYGDDRLQSRRDQPKYLNLICTVAFIRQLQKERKKLNRNGNTIPYIEVDLDDITIANELTRAVLGKSLDELSAPARQLLLLIEQYIDKRLLALREQDDENVPSCTHVAFTRRELRDFSGWNKTRIHTYLGELLAMEYVVSDGGRSNCLQHYRLLYEGQGKDGSKFVPGLKSVDTIRQEYERDKESVL